MHLLFRKDRTERHEHAHHDFTVNHGQFVPPAFACVSRVVQPKTVRRFLTPRILRIQFSLCVLVLQVGEKQDREDHNVDRRTWHPQAENDVQMIPLPTPDLQIGGQPLLIADRLAIEQIESGSCQGRCEKVKYHDHRHAKCVKRRDHIPSLPTHHFRSGPMALRDRVVC